jgi:hypothetical protein
MRAIKTNEFLRSGHRNPSSAPDRSGGMVHPLRRRQERSRRVSAPVVETGVEKTLGVPLFKSK